MFLFLSLFEHTVHPPSIEQIFDVVYEFMIIIIILAGYRKHSFLYLFELLNVKIKYSNIKSLFYIFILNEKQRDKLRRNRERRAGTTNMT